MSSILTPANSSLSSSPDRHSPNSRNNHTNMTRTNLTRALYNQPHNRPSVRSALASPTSGSVTTTISSSPADDPDSSLVLRLRGAHNAQPPATEAVTSPSPPTSPRQRVTWAEDVIDNEGLGRKSSKVCCIYHKAREFGDSSGEDSSSDSDSDASDSADDGAARMVGGNRRARKHDHGHEHSDDCAHASGSSAGDSARAKGKQRRKPSPNAYEKVPKYNGVKQQRQTRS